jgi:hypothetical protein
LPGTLPDHPVNVQFACGVAVKTTEVFCGTDLVEVLEPARAATEPASG